MLTGPLILGLLSFVAVTLGIVVVGWMLAERATPEQKRAHGRIQELGNSSNLLPHGGITGASGRRFAVSFGVVIDLLKSKGAVRLQSKLALAGYRQLSAVVYFRSIQLILILTLSVAGGVVATLCGVGWMKVPIWVALGGVVGFFGPSYVLSSQVNHRQRMLRNALPDALDIMLLCVEGGASLNAAVTWVAEEILPVHPVLGMEMQIVLHEMQLGLSAGESFRSFADRSGISESRELAATLLQSERYGASVAKTLRAYSDTARQERQQWAEEMAHKAAVKILFPMLVCIFPAMFIVLIGPAAFQMASLFAR